MSQQVNVEAMKMTAAHKFILFVTYMLKCHCTHVSLQLEQLNVIFTALIFH